MTITIKLVQTGEIKVYTDGAVADAEAVYLRGRGEPFEVEVA